MSLADTSKSIGKLTQLLRDHLNAKTGINVSVGRPEPPQGVSPGARLNLFLYEAKFDPMLRNQALDEGQPAPVWLILKYILTAFDDNGNSDTIQSHENCGDGIRALQELSWLPLSNHLSPDPEINAALKDNPETLKITFEETTSELLSKIMQGGDEKYRFSVSFQVRPIMIATGEPPSYSLLVGVDYSQTPHDIIGEKGIQIPITPSMGPEILEVAPARSETDETITIFGNNLHLSNLSVHLDSVDLPIVTQKPDRLECKIRSDIIHGGVISAGNLPLSVILTLPTGRRRSSNLVVYGLLPVLETVTPDTLTRVTPADPNSKVFGNLDITGTFLGTANDDVYVALFKDGKVVKMFDEISDVPIPPTDPQTAMRIEIKQENALEPGTYRVILRVNGSQAKTSPEVELTIP